MTSGWWPPPARSSAMRSTQWATPLTSGGRDSVMIATLMVTPCDINRSRRRSRHDLQANLPCLLGFGKIASMDPTWIVRLDVPGDGPRLAVKDCIDVEGLPTTAGCQVVSEQASPAGAAAPVVAAA